MNFQTSKRIMCCLMAVLILCCAVVRPIEAQASVLAVGTIVGVYAAQTLISSMIAMGVVYQSYELLTDFVNNLVTQIPDDYIYTNEYGTVTLEAVLADGKYYVPLGLVEWLRMKLWAASEVYGNATTYEFPYGRDVPGGSLSFEDAFSKLVNSDGTIKESFYPILSATNYSYTYRFDSTEYGGGFYYFGKNKPTYETTVMWKDGVGDVPALYVKCPEDGIIIYYHSVINEWLASVGGSHLFPYATTMTQYDFSQKRTVTLQNVGIKEDFTPKIDSDKYQTWIDTGIWIVILDDSGTGNGGNGNDNDNKERIPFIPVRTSPYSPSLTPEEAQDGTSGQHHIQTGPNVDIYDNDGYQDDGPAANPADYDDTNLLEQLKLFGIDLKNGFNDMVNRLLSIFNTVVDILRCSENILQAIQGLADLFIPKLIEGIKNTWNDYLDLLVQKFGPLFNFISEGLPALLQKLAEWLEPLIDYLLNGLKNLFIPKQGYFDAKINELRQEFKLFDALVGTVYDLRIFLLNLGSTPPVIYANLSAANGSIDWGNNVVFVDMSWYGAYKPTMDAVLSGFLWLWFAWRMVLSIPGILGGASGIWRNSSSYTKHTKEEE